MKLISVEVKAVNSPEPEQVALTQCLLLGSHSVEKELVHKQFRIQDLTNQNKMLKTRTIPPLLPALWLEVALSKAFPSRRQPLPLRMSESSRIRLRG